jgi:uncharacterized membrane protein
MSVAGLEAWNVMLGVLAAVMFAGTLVLLFVAAMTEERRYWIAAAVVPVVGAILVGLSVYAGNLAELAG